MDCPSSSHEPIPRAGQCAPVHNEENLQLTALGLHELKVQVRCPAVTLRPGAWLAACESTDVWGPLHCPDRRRSTSSASRPAALGDPPSGPPSPRRAIANRRETAPGDVPVARTR